MRCKDCNYCWKNDGEKFASCKWESQCPGDCPPCEYDDELEDYAFSGGVDDFEYDSEIY